MLPGGDGCPAPAPPASTINNAERFVLPLDLGKVVATEVLAQGGMGITFLGHLASDSQQVAIKIPVNADANLQERFRNEARLLAQLNHDQIVRFIAAGESEISLADEKHKLPWLAMEFIPGQSLRAKLSQGASMPWAEVSRMLEDVLSALDHLYAANLCHRDIKPDNLIHDPRTNSWKLVDFGIAKALVENLRLTLTLAETNPGAWDYMSPEQLSGQPVDIRSDIYSLGKTAWEALIGEVPRVGTAYPSAFLGSDRVPPDVDLLIRRMVEHRPESRYQTPAEALTALREGAGVIANKEERRKSTRKFVRILKLAVATVALTAGVWLVGNELATQKAKEIVSSVSTANLTRATLLRRKLETFRNAHWFWGRRYADAQFAKFEQAANEERRRMGESYQEIVSELSNAGQEDNFKLERCRNFCALYSEAFQDTREYKDLSAKKEIFEARVVSTEAEQLAKAGKIGEALQRCDDLKSKLTVTEAVTKISDTRGNIIRGVAEKELIEIKRLAASKNEDDLVLAQTKVSQLEKIVGVIPETQSALKLVDDSLYSVAVDTAKTRLARKEYNSARASLDRYLELSELKAHKADALNEKGKIDEIEDENDWSIVTASAEKNLNQNAFALATQDYNNYLKKWPGGRHASDARQGFQSVAAKHFKFLADIKDYDDFVEEFKKFAVQYPQESERLRTAKQWLVFHSWKEMARLFDEVGSKKMQPLTALNRVNQLDWQTCEPTHRQRLESLADKLRAWLNAPSWNTSCSFLYLYQRPPGDCVKMNDSPTVYVVTVDRVDVVLSDWMFKKLKGSNNADPRIDLKISRKSSGDTYSNQSDIDSVLGSVNQRAFTVNVNKQVWFNTAINGLDTSLYDDDAFGGGYLTGVNFVGIEARSGSRVWRSDDGTSLTIFFKLE